MDLKPAIICAGASRVLRNGGFSMVREFRKGDLDEVMEIWLISNLQAHDFISKKYWNKNFTEIQRVLQLADVYVWEEDGKIQGFGGSMQGFLIGIFLREEYRGKGIGKALLARMRRGEESMSVAVYQKNIRGVRFYMREGFKVQSERTEESTGEKEFLLEWKK